MSDIVSLLSQYEVLKFTASHLSTLDLFHLGFSNTHLYGLILKSKTFFKLLTSHNLCDGRGLKARQQFKGLYALHPEDHLNNNREREPRYDEEIEVRVWNLKCDSTNALPCLKCNVNICEECRYVPRVRDQPEHRSEHKIDHVNPRHFLNNNVCYCSTCDERVESDLPSRLSEYCDCDMYTRWVCMPCQIIQDEEDNNSQCTARAYGDYDWEEEEGEDTGNEMWLNDIYDDQQQTLWCSCGVRILSGCSVRCNWCKRRHEQGPWKRNDSNGIPYFDKDPCYPKTVWNWNSSETIYPPLDYAGPIYWHEDN